MSLRKKPTPVSINIKRVAAVIACMVCMSFTLIGGLLHKSGIINAVNPAADETAERVQYEMMLETTTEGLFLDRNGYALTEVEGPGIPAEIIFPESMSHIIGYNSAKYSLSGLRQRYSDHLFNGGKDGLGADITLTIDADLQEFCFQLLEGQEGSISVIDADGEVLALASRSHPVVDYNANDIEIENRFDEYNSLPAFFLNRAIMAEDPPGSTFKLITAAAMLENDMEEYTFDDPGELWISDNYAIHNFNNDCFGKDITLDKALEKSINTYFASAGIILGPARMQDIAERFGYGTEIELDFATLKSNANMGNMADKALTASTSYGQGRLSVSPIQINMMMQAILNKGEMLRPYMISSIVNDDKTVHKGSSEVLLKSVSPKVANRLCELLHDTALHYGYDDSALGAVYAKTGTAEMANGKNHIYLVLGQRCVSGGTYSIVIDHRNVDTTSGTLHKTAESVLNYLAYYDLNKIGGTRND